ncbi:MAG: type III-B CRISPR-associated protein Cas10/Cmr2 [Leptolyngbya sp. SIOISBB]|nr:type III-B CRISPR-associated protein Cas10/Cmr2 [Leptolyngbya sp. SIOISBB]
MTTQNQPSGNVQAFYARKLYALLRDAPDEEPGGTLFADLAQEIPELGNLGVDTWWKNAGPLLSDIGSASDRANLQPASALPDEVEVRHPISGQSQQLTRIQSLNDKERVKAIKAAKAALEVANDPTETLKRLYWWCWRFYPELRENRETAFLNPAHRILPDCPIPSYNSTVAALSGAMFPSDWQPENEAQKPHLLLFTFSPVQEFIKASRKLVDFWSGSYMLHYLSVKLCWYIAQEYGPDAVITPSLWGQEIIDALLVNRYSDFKSFFKNVENPDIDVDPVSLFNRRESASLSTAGFPNTITALVPSKEKAIALGQALQKELKDIWCDIAKQVREHIKTRVIEHLSDQGFDEAWKTLKDLFPESEHDTYQTELRKYQQHGCWEWNKLWRAQIENTWQPYFVAVPLGHPENVLAAAASDQDWIDQQNAIALTREALPTPAEKQAYQTLNVGTWWGSLQARLGQSMQAIKNTRRWQIPIAPGERSSLSGQFSALHPCLHYEGRLKHGRGMAAGSIRMFWKLMSLAYPGLFDGSERLNALELTKRMAWIYGGVAEALGIDVSKTQTRIRERRESIERHQKAEESTEQVVDLQQPNRKFKIEQSIQLRYEFFSRFPNTSSIAAGRFIHDHPKVAERYWQVLEQSIRENLPRQRRAFKLVTRIRPTNIAKTDRKINPEGSRRRYSRKNLNGVMFYSKWLAQDLTLNKDSKPQQETGETEDVTATLRGLVSKAHQDVGFGDSSPSDWWVLLLADGDGMGQYVNGRNLHSYKEYLLEDLVNHSLIEDEAWSDFLTNTKKRMGPATHVGLNRALLDFSNRLVPHLTEHRYCGKVIYSGGDDVLVALPLADLPGYVRSLRAAWCGGEDPGGKEPSDQFQDVGDYWRPRYPEKISHLPNRPLFTMGKGATMSMGIIIAHKSVPLPTVLENLWEAEKERAKKLLGGSPPDAGAKIPPKDGLCFRIVYGSGNTLEALMKGHLLELWWEMIKDHPQYDLSPVFNRLAEELPKHVEVTPNHHLCRQAAQAILLRREDQLSENVQNAILNWLSEWEAWAWTAQQTAIQRQEKAQGTELKDLAALLRFTAFWVSRRRQELNWVGGLKQPEVPESETSEVSYV